MSPSSSGGRIGRVSACHHHCGSDRYCPVRRLQVFPWQVSYYLMTRLFGDILPLPSVVSPTSNMKKSRNQLSRPEKVIHAFFHSLQGSLKPRSGSNSVKFVTMNWFPLSLNPVGLGASKMDRMTPSRNVSPFSVSWRYPVVPRRISLAHSVTGGSPRMYHRLRK